MVAAAWRNYFCGIEVCDIFHRIGRTYNFMVTKMLDSGMGTYIRERIKGYKMLVFHKDLCTYEMNDPYLDIPGIQNYSGTSLKRTLAGQKFLSALERCPSWRGLN